MNEPVDVAVIGGGLMGAAAAWSLARRGRSVVLLEQFTIGHPHGSSHGSARIIRRAYADALYTRLTGQAFELWRELEQQAGVTLLRVLGGIDHGAAGRVEPVVERLAEAGVPHERLDPDEAMRRWPGMRFAGPVVYHPQAGTIDAASAVVAFLEQARAHGADLRESTAVTAISPSTKTADVTLADGSTLRARCVVAAAGAWAPTLLAGLIPLPPLAVTRQDVCHFTRLDASAAPWPSTIHRDTAEVYHLAGGRDADAAGPSRKVGRHDLRRPATPSSLHEPADPAFVEWLVGYVTDWLPGLEPTPHTESTCLYTTTPSDDFVLDRVGPIVVCSPCSGHGAKFAPLVGELVSDLVTGQAYAVPGRFRLTAHASAAPARISL